MDKNKVNKNKVKQRINSLPGISAATRGIAQRLVELYAGIEDIDVSTVMVPRLGSQSDKEKTARGNAVLILELKGDTAGRSWLVDAESPNANPDEGPDDAHVLTGDRLDPRYVEDRLRGRKAPPDSDR